METKTSFGAPKLEDSQPVSENFPEIISSYLVATTAEKTGDWEMAEAAYTISMVENPQNYKVRFKAYTYALANSANINSMDNALRIAKTFKVADNPGVITWVFLAVDAAQNGKYDHAKIYLKRVEQIVPNLLHYKALDSLVTAASSKKITKTIKDLENFNGHNSLKARQYYHASKLHAMAGDVAGRIKALELSQELESGALFTILDLGEQLELAGKLVEAKQVYDTFLKNNPDALLLQHVFDRWRTGVEIQTKSPNLSDNMSEVIFGFSMLMWSQQLDLAARQLLNIALWLNPNPLYYFYVGMMDEQAWRLDSAIAQYAKITEGKAGWLAAQVRIAEVLFKQNKQLESVEIMENLQAKYPHKNAFNRTLADMHYELENFSTAIKYYSKIIALPEFLNMSLKVKSKLYYARGAAYERMQNIPKAAKDFLSALELEPENSSVLNYLGYMWLDNDMHINKAFELVKKAALINPSSGAILDSLGWGYYKKGAYSQALLYLNKAVKLIPTDATVIEHLGDVHNKLGNKELAKQYWQEALNLEPDGARERARLQKKLQ